MQLSPLAKGVSGAAGVKRRSLSVPPTYTVINNYAATA